MPFQFAKNRSHLPADIGSGPQRRSTRATWRTELGARARWKWREATRDSTRRAPPRPSTRAGAAARTSGRSAARMSGEVSESDEARLGQVAGEKSNLCRIVTEVGWKAREIVMVQTVQERGRRVSEVFAGATLQSALPTRIITPSRPATRRAYSQTGRALSDTSYWRRCSAEEKRDCLSPPPLV